jgi:hypothetical protein
LDFRGLDLRSRGQELLPFDGDLDRQPSPHPNLFFSMFECPGGVWG